MLYQSQIKNRDSMRYLPNINKRLIVILLLMHVIVAYAIPAWASINICIGFDGHVDFEKRGHVGRTSNPYSLMSIVSSDDGHHVHCFDIGISGFLTERLYVRAEESNLLVGKSTPNTDSEKLLNSNMVSSEVTPNPLFYPISCALPSSILTFHQTVVLII